VEKDEAASVRVRKSAGQHHHSKETEMNEAHDQLINKAVRFVADRAISDEKLDENTLSEVLGLVARRIESLPFPAIIDDIFKDAGVGLIWIPQPAGQVTPPLQEWSTSEQEMVNAGIEIIGNALVQEMQRTNCPIIECSAGAARIIVYRSDLLERAKELFGLTVLQ
jgi:hypothetical protein